MAYISPTLSPEEDCNMLRSTGFASLLVALLGLPSWAMAAGERYAFDKVHTQILFFVDHLGFSKSQGEFHDYTGGFTFDPQHWEDGAVDMSIRTASLDMDDAKWDEHLRSKDFFDVAHFPEMRFKSLRVERSGEQTGVVHGELTLLGVTRPVDLEVHFNKAGIHPVRKDYVAGFSARATVTRSEFGMNYGLGMLGDAVEVRLEVEGIRQDAVTP
jgi:polyisoprenoid-binding protein YceI